MMISGNVRRGSSSQIIFADGFRAAAARHPRRSALLVGDQALTFPRLVERMDRLSNLVRHGLKIEPGSVSGSSP